MAVVLWRRLRSRAVGGGGGGFSRSEIRVSLSLFQTFLERERERGGFWAAQRDRSRVLQRERERDKRDDFGPKIRVTNVQFLFWAKSQISIDFGPCGPGHKTCSVMGQLYELNSIGSV